MKQVGRCILEGNYKNFLSSYGIDIEEALRKIGQPEDTFNRQNSSMSVEGYFAFIDAAIAQVYEPNLPIRMGTAEDIRTFSPPVFAAYCSKNGRTCFERLARYKRLIGPLDFAVEEFDKNFSIEVKAQIETLDVPKFLVEVEFVFLVNLVRSATKENISPIIVELKNFSPTRALANFLNCPIKVGNRNVVTFSAKSMDVPFVTWNENMWSYFEPELRRRLAELDVEDSFTTRVKSALMELLPSGDSSIDGAAQKLGMSKRTLQRKLEEEGTTFRWQLNYTRELLAKHYLKSKNLGVDEIAYLLGYQELNSFFRAFHAWTGMTISNYKKSLQ